MIYLNLFEGFTRRKKVAQVVTNSEITTQEYPYNLPYLMEFSHMPY
jgi:hypothetical protein